MYSIYELCHTTAAPQLGGGSIVRDTWNIRIHAHVKEYFKKRSINPREILEQKYYELKKSELPELLKEKEKLLTRVAQIDTIVPQLEVNCATEISKLDTLSKTYIETGRSIEKPTSKDISWLTGRCGKEKIPVNAVLDRCRELKEGGYDG